MAYKMTKKPSTIARYFKGKNFVTPEVREYGQINPTDCYELSYGDFNGKQCYGVTVVRVVHGKPVEPLRDASQMFHSLRDAKAHIHLLRNNTAPRWLARQRQDLLDAGLKIPTGSGAFIEVPEWLEYRQPENLEGRTYNAVLYKNGYPWERVMSIDLEFKEKEA